MYRVDRKKINLQTSLQNVRLPPLTRTLLNANILQRKQKFAMRFVATRCAQIKSDYIWTNFRLPSSHPMAAVLAILQFIRLVRFEYGTESLIVKNGI